MAWGVASKMISCVLVAGTIPNSMGNLTNLEKLRLHGNGALDKPSGCSLYQSMHMLYEIKDEFNVLLRCLAYSDEASDSWLRWHGPEIGRGL